MRIYISSNSNNSGIYIYNSIHIMKLRYTQNKTLINLEKANIYEQFFPPNHLHIN